jgi:hypothetical protein
MKSWIRICIKMERIRNPGKNDYQTKVSAPDSTPGLALPAYGYRLLSRTTKLQAAVAAAKEHLNVPWVAA